MNKIRTLLLAGMLVSGWARADFVIQDIQVEGLQRISAGTVFNYLPVSVGSKVKPEDYPAIIRALFQTGFFTDVSLEQKGNVLVVTVTERPAIAEVNITGNKDISTENLTKSLVDVGLAEGRVFDRSLLEKVEQELIRQYYSRGKYAVKINAEVKPLERNRVAINLDISEGVAARIRQINIVGNKAFSDKELLRELQLSSSGMFSIITQDDQYSKQKLAADIESLRSFYLDRGYLKFTVDSTQVSITPDKKDVYITVNITEGDRYTIQDVRLAGEFIVPEPELRKLVTLKAGETFSRSKLTEINKAISDRLGDEGYAFANVNTVPELNEADKKVALTFVVDPGKRVYVRRINFKGNLKTQDEVLRREMRQTEGSWFATKDVKRSKTRLERLTYLESVDLETPAVPGTTDQVDINYTVAERPSGNFIFGVGYGQDAGVLFNASLNQNNFLGTGNQLSLIFNNSQADTNYDITYNNPYFTADGISRGFRLYYRQRDAAQYNVASYLADDYGAKVNFGIPLNEFDVLNVGIAYTDTQIKTTTSTPLEILAYLAVNGNEYQDFPLEASWVRDTRNRVIFADRGSFNRLLGEITVPGSDLEYYKLGYKHTSYFPLSRSLTLSLGGELGYGDGYAGTDGLPFFENFYAGGLRTVRGYKSNTLGPKYPDGEPSGGSFKVVGNAEVNFPVPFLRDSNNMRLATFVDVGNVFATFGDFDAGQLRYSTGVAVWWISPLGPLVLSLAAPLNSKSGDQTENFQFSFGVPF